LTHTLHLHTHMHRRNRRGPWHQRHTCSHRQNLSRAPVSTNDQSQYTHVCAFNMHFCTRAHIRPRSRHQRHVGARHTRLPRDDARRQGIRLQEIHSHGKLQLQHTHTHTSSLIPYSLQAAHVMSCCAVHVEQRSGRSHIPNVGMCRLGWCRLACRCVASASQQCHPLSLDDAPQACLSQHTCHVLLAVPNFITNLVTFME